MATSYTGTINASDWASVASLTGVTFTSGKTYNIQVRKQCQLKVDNAIFDAFNRDVIYVAGSKTLYIKTGGVDCGLTILECE